MIPITRRATKRNTARYVGRDRSHRRHSRRIATRIELHTTSADRRRTLALELAHRPGGVLAAKVHLKHVSVATTEGYAARPGGSQGHFLSEIAKEERVRDLALTIQAFNDYQAGVLPAGPGEAR